MGAKSDLELEAQHHEGPQNKASSYSTGKRLLQALVVAGVLLLFRHQFHRVTANITTKTPDFSSLHYSKQCPGLEFIGTAEYAARRTALAHLLRGDGSAWGAYISEPSPNTLYYAGLTSSDWYTSERPWLVAITPEGESSHLSVLTPAFEKSRSQRLPWALSEDDFQKVSWVAWQEEQDPYQIMVEHLQQLRERDGASGEWTIHVEENVRQFVSTGLQAAGESLQTVQPIVNLAALVVREQRMRKTENEIALQRCAGKVTVAALRALILAALTAAGLTHLDSIVLFGENAALPHASAGSTRKLRKGDFALFDVGGALDGYFSDYTRTMLPDAPKSRWGAATFGRFGGGCHGASGSSSQKWPSARAEEIWKTVKAGQEAALAVLVPQNASSVVFAAEVDRAARDVLTAAGYGAFFTHRVGHGIGLQVHEHPYLNSGNVAQALQPGETFSNEPGIYIEQSIDPEGSGIGHLSTSLAMVLHDSMLSLVGNTPLVRLDKIAREEGLKCSLFAKCEFMNAGGSVKDRIALRMVEKAEQEGRITPGKTVLVEASSGNTGIGLAMVAAIKGYRCIITMPEKMSKEKENTIKALGAEIIRTPTEAAHDSPDSNMGRANTLLQEIPNAVMLDQYGNPDNPNAHYYGTAPEIIADLAATPSGLCDLIVAGTGTGGTITGLSKRLREHNPSVVVLGVDPRGSILARPESLNKLEPGESDMYRVEGIGYDFIPDVLKHEAVDRWIKCDDASSFAATRRVIRTEGILCGGSSGSAIACTLKYLKSEEGRREFDVEGKNVVILLADSIRNYVTSSWLSETDAATPAASPVASPATKPVALV
ncbi:hypothetical protein RQP46_010968 [Phenoliferia psychrophenolica]